MSPDELYQEFLLDRQAKDCTTKTLEFYEYTAGNFVAWLGDKNITPSLVRKYITYINSNGFKSTTKHGHARGVRAFINFAATEGYIKPIRVAMPHIDDTDLPVLTAKEVQKVLKACKSPRDTALILLMVDAGLRRNEVLALKWSDVKPNGKVKVRSGKGRKYRVVFIGQQSWLALMMHYNLTPRTDRIFNLTQGGIRSALNRIGKRACVTVTPHALRRSFATLSIRAGMSLEALRRLMGHKHISTTQKYLFLVDDDLQEAHQACGPIDNLLKLNYRENVR